LAVGIEQLAISILVANIVQISLKQKAKVRCKIKMRTILKENRIKIGNA